MQPTDDGMQMLAVTQKVVATEYPKALKVFGTVLLVAALLLAQDKGHLLVSLAPLGTVLLLKGFVPGVTNHWQLLVKDGRLICQKDNATHWRVPLTDIRAIQIEPSSSTWLGKQTYPNLLIKTVDDSFMIDGITDHDAVISELRSWTGTPNPAPATGVGL